MKKIISFVNRTYASLNTAFLKLKTRYKQVSIEFKLVKGLLCGHFIVKHAW